MKIIFKHSTRCPISTGAKREMDAFLKSNTRELEYELVDVIDNRPRSNEVAEQLGIPHESPQIIVLDDNGNVTWHESHHAITQRSISKAIG